MKIRCNNCNKRFDQEKYCDVCPKCGTVHTVQNPSGTPADSRSFYDDLFGTSTHPTTEDTFIIGGVERKQQSAYNQTSEKPATNYSQADATDYTGYNQAVTTNNTDHTQSYKVQQTAYNKSAPVQSTNHIQSEQVKPIGPKKNRIVWIPCVILILLILLVYIVPTVAVHNYNQRIIQENTLETLPEVETYTYPEPIYVDNNDYVIKFSEIKEIDVASKDFPRGFDLIQFSYEVKSAHVSADTSMPYNIYSGIKVYLKTKSGLYLEPLYSREVCEYLNIPPAKSDALNISDSFNMSEGNMYFLVRENDMDILRITCQNKHYDTEATPLERIIELEKLEVKN